MKKILILVEGQTEVEFVNNILAPYLGDSFYITSIILKTKRTKSGPDFKGGVSSYAKARPQIVELLGDSSVDVVTTMFDLYALPDDFPGVGGIGTITVSPEKARYVEDAMGLDIANNRYFPHVQLHEFEALLFADAGKIGLIAKGKEIQEFQKIRSEFATPEDINNGIHTAPSKRITRIIPDYNKVATGYRIAQDIGIHKIMEECPHFRQWVEVLRNI